MVRPAACPRRLPRISIATQHWYNVRARSSSGWSDAFNAKRVWSEPSSRPERHRVDLFEGAQAFTIKVADLEDEGCDPRDVESKSADQAVLDAQFAEAALRDIVTSHDKVLADPEPMVKLHALDDSSMNFIVRPWVNTGGY